MSNSLESGLPLHSPETITKEDLDKKLKEETHDKIIKWLENKNLGKEK